MEFDNIKVSTKTYTASLNLKIDLEKLFEIIPITQYTIIEKKRGRKKKNSEVVDPNKNINYGSIITLRYKNKIKGVNLKYNKKSSNKKNTWFRNCITIVIIFEKMINFKVYKNGTFQMTGCKTYNHAIECIKCIWGYIKNEKDIWTFTNGNILEAMIISSMRNIDFDLGFHLDREKFDVYIKNRKDISCLIESTSSSTSISVPLKNDIEKMPILILSENNNEWNIKDGIYKNYLDILTPKERKNKLVKERYNTFLIFYSGSVIMIGLTRDYMRDVYEKFINIIKEAKDEIEEKLIE